MCNAHYDIWRRDNRPVAAAPVAAHLRALREAGVGITRIAKITGLGINTVWGMDRPHRKWVYAETARRVFAIPLPDLPHAPIAAAGRPISSVGTARRLQALQAIGYTNAQLAAEIGYFAEHLTPLMRGDRLVSVKTARRVVDIFNRLQLVPPPDTIGAKRARLRAARRGWVPPFAWDEDAIDDPTAAPSKDWQPGGNADWLAMVVEWRQHRRTDEEIAEHLGIAVESLWRKFDRAGLPRDHGRAA